MFVKEKTKWLEEKGKVKRIQLECDLGFKTYVLEFPGGIFVYGDQQPSTLRKDCSKSLRWLCTAKGDYLYEKTLHEVFSTEQLLEDFEQLLEDYSEDPEEHAREIATVNYAIEHVDEFKEYPPPELTLSAIIANVYGDLGDGFEKDMSFYSHFDEMRLGYGFDESDCRRIDNIAECVRFLLEEL